MARPRDDRQKDLLRPALEEIIDLGQPLVRSAREIDWGFLDRRFASVCAPVRVSPACRPSWWRGCSSRAEARRLLKEAGAENLTFELLNRNVDQPYKFNGTWVVDEWSKR